ncbi:TetR/AcrR family transcriptional regulator [Leifsonia poae]|uniref:TetR/AcrR family transcriptional regulator n=1 Tax=Leifsonia poae TaxID=110933 RepID=UPI003D69FA68
MSTRQEGYASGRARKERILEAAVAAFGASGFEHATLTDIATACGVSRQGLLHHFASKEELLTAVLQRRDDTDRRSFDAALANNRTPSEALAEIIADNAQSPTVMRLYTVLSAEATNPDHAAHDYFAALYTRLRAQLTEAIATAQDAGDAPSGLPPETFATLLLAIKDGLALQALLSPGEVDPVRTIRELTAALEGAGR